MPQTKSAKKALRQNIKRRAHNRAIRSAVRTQIRKLRTLIAEGDLPKAQQEIRRTVKVIDQCVAKGLMHKNTAARTKSRLAHRLNALAAKATQPTN